MTAKKRAVPNLMRPDVKRAAAPAAAASVPFAHLAGADLSAWHDHLRGQAVQEEDAAAQSVIDAMSAGRSKIQR